MKKTMTILLLVICLSTFTSGIADASFDFSLFSNRSSPYYSVFDKIVYEDEYAFITPTLTYPEMEFTHIEASPNYYSTISPDILVIDYGTNAERVAFRIKITYFTELAALKPYEAIITLGKNTYCFDISEDTDSYISGSSTNTDSIFLVLNSDSIPMMVDWCDAVNNEEHISVTLTGASNSITFDVPDKVATTTALTYNAYVAADGLLSLKDIVGTPALVTTASTNLFERITKDNLNGQTLYIESIDGALSFPADYWVLKKNMDVTSPVLSHFNLSSTKVNKILEEAGIEFDIISEDEYLEYSVSIIDANGLSFSGLNFNSKNQLNRELRIILSSTGRAINDTRFIDTPYSRIWRCESTTTELDNTKTYTLTYYAINNDKMLVVNAYSYEKDFSAFQRKICDAIASTIRFGKHTSNQILLSTERFEDDSNPLSASFSIPSLWYTEKVSAAYEDQFSIELRPFGNHSVFLKYGITDYYQYLIKEGNAPSSRNATFTEEDYDLENERVQEVLKNLNLPKDSYVDYIQIGNQKYMYMFMHQPVEYGNLTVDSLSLGIYYFDTSTGIIHTYAYTSSDETAFNMYLDEVISIIESANYPVQS